MHTRLIGFSLVALLAGCAVAADKDFQPLFSLDGSPKGWTVREWNDLTKKVSEAEWTVKDGVLHSGQRRGTWLMSDKEYTDFILEFEIKLTKVGNSGVARCLEIQAARRGDDAGLCQPRAVQIGPQIDELALRGRQLALGIERFDLDVRVCKLEQHSVRLHRIARLDEDALDPRGSERGDPANVLGHERSRTPHLAHHLPAAHRVDPEGTAIDARCRGLQAREHDRRDHDGGDGPRALQILAAFGTWCARNVHGWYAHSDDICPLSRAGAMPRTASANHLWARRLLPCYGQGNGG